MFTQRSHPRQAAALIPAVWLALAGCGADAQTVYTEPTGQYTVKIPGTTGLPGTARTYLGIQLLPHTVAMGQVSGRAGATFQLDGIDAAGLGEAEKSYYAHVLDGAGRGKILEITGFSASGFTCAENTEPWVETLTSVRIRPHSRLSDIFGATNKFGFGTGTSASQADNIVVWDTDTQHERVFFFHSSHDRWEEDGIDGDAGNTPVRFPNGCFLVRRTAGTLRMVLSGEIGSEAVLLPVRTGSNVFSLPVNLSGSLDAVVSTSGANIVVSGANAATADLLSFEEPATHTRRGPFYRLERDGATGWREIGVDDSDAPLEPLDFLSTLVLQRSGPPGLVLMEGSPEPPAVPRPPLPPDPEPGEVELTGEFQLPPTSPDTVLTVEVSTDLQSWSAYATPVLHPDNRVTFTLPAGQTRAFYRLAISVSP